MRNRWIVCPNPIPAARLRLFCIPFAGGDTWIFQKWWMRVPSDVEVCPIRLPGRGARIAEKAFTELIPLVTALAHALEEYLESPFAIFGHSMGGLVAFELARHFRRHLHASPVHLFVAAHRAPHLPSLYPPMSHLPDHLFIAELVRRHGAPNQMLYNKDLMHLLLPTVRADLSVCETYIHTAEPPLDCPISVFGGNRDDMVNLFSLDAWRLHTRASFSRRLLPGNHLFLSTSQPALLRSLSEDLSRSV
jgi:medium-chain acyl-[acyl-carrier-protein] hydrolase